MDLNSLQSKDSSTLVDLGTTIEVSEQDFKDSAVFADVPKKRKSLEGRWREEVHVCQLEDGYNWRKYGMNYVLRASHPRSYYRCRHRHTHGCLATKQVQQVERGEDDSCIFKVVYKGKHSCAPKQNKDNDEAKQRKLEDDATQFLSEPEPTPGPESYSLNKIEHSFDKTDSLPLGDLDFLIDQVDFEAGLMEVSDYLSEVQESPATKI